MSYKILFWPDINYEPGHWRPVMSMAEKARKMIDGCQIKFLCTPECRPIVANVKMPDNSRLFADDNIEEIFPDLFPIGYSSLAVEKPEEARSRIDHCLRIAEGEFDELLRSCEPNLLIAGYFVSLEALLIKRRYNQVILRDINKGLTDSKKIPEMEIMITTTFLRHPSEDPAITSLRFLTHHAQELSSKLMRATIEGSDENYNYNGSLSSIQNFISPLDDTVELITCPRELEFEDFEHRENTYYVEPCILDTNPNTDHELTKDPNLIYASAGSRVRDYIESAKSMFRTLQSMLKISAANRRKLEMAVGYTLREEFESANNITIKEWADQAESLKRSRSAVIHGGLASIKECIYFGIAPIVVPMGKDQMDNALRVVENEVGSMLMLDDLTGEGIYNAIMRAEGNISIKKSMERMHDKFIMYETASPPRSIIEIKKVLGIQ